MSAVDWKQIRIYVEQAEADQLADNLSSLNTVRGLVCAARLALDYHEQHDGTVVIKHLDGLPGTGDVATRN